MTGLESILTQINDDAQKETQEQLAAANAKADEILEAARQEAAAKAEGILKEGERQAQDIRDRAESAAQLARRNAMLSFKQELIKASIEETKAGLENASDGEYFSTLLKLVTRFAQPGKAEMRLNAKDIKRVPSGFASDLKAAAPQTDITVASLPCDVSGGFLLVYDGIDVNCSFDAIFEDADAELRDAAGRLLFPTA